jgi:hypothetical protein
MIQLYARASQATTGLRQAAFFACPECMAADGRGAGGLADFAL